MSQKTDTSKIPDVLAALLAHGWFKTIGISSGMAVFFVGYMYLLKHPAFPVHTIPVTWLDNFLSFQPAALPIYLSLWVYVSLPVALMLSQREIIAYGFRIAVPCLIGFAIFYCWPNAVAPAPIDWEKYPNVAFLKSVDTAGNAFPSLHVATAVFSAHWLYWRFKRLQLGWPVQLLNVLWCVAIAYSTLAIKQHVALDVFAGAVLGVISAWATGLKTHALGVGKSKAQVLPVN
ncbi:MAG: phosphoesterase, PA-phosphatase related [Verrucomicrobiaceae bacterium]|nr:phosphoesterase, PA-phosphatase related [Verrucomicrobiaceae bacterium]